MSKPFQPPKPRFSAGDRVVVIGPGIYRDKQATVMKIIEPRSGDFVYRYRVRFTDGTPATFFFGFELEISEET
jgi:hypothetical protein